MTFWTAMLILWIVAGLLVLFGKSQNVKYYKIEYAICWVVLLFYIARESIK